MHCLLVKLACIRVAVYQAHMLCCADKSKAEAAVQASLQQQQQQQQQQQKAQGPCGQDSPPDGVTKAQQQQQQQQQPPHSSGAQAQQQLQGRGTQALQHQPRNVKAQAQQQQQGIGAQGQPHLPQSSGAHAQQHHTHTPADQVAGAEGLQQQQQQQQQASNPFRPPQGEGQGHLSLCSNQSTGAHALWQPVQDLTPSALGGPLQPPHSSLGNQDGEKDLHANGLQGSQGSASPAHSRGVLESSASDLQGVLSTQHSVSPGAQAPQLNMQNPCDGASRGSGDVQGRAGRDHGVNNGGTQAQAHGLLSKGGPLSAGGAAVHKGGQTRPNGHLLD
eukprot:1153527-Pelagomonas_calceolata.AAC.1